MMILLRLAAVLALVFSSAAAAPARACSSPQTQRLPFCNSSLALSARIDALVKLLTVKEKIGLVSTNQQPITRLGIPGYDWGTECLHGVVVQPSDQPVPKVGARGATVFPQPLGLAATFDTALMQAVGNAISDEARAISNVGGSKNNGLPAFLNCFSPNINLFRGESANP